MVVFCLGDKTFDVPDLNNYVLPKVIVSPNEDLSANFTDVHLTGLETASVTDVKYENNLFTFLYYFLFFGKHINFKKQFPNFFLQFAQIYIKYKTKQIQEIVIVLF